MQSVLYHIITTRDVDELEVLYALVVEDAIQLHWGDTRCIQGDAHRMAMPRRVPCARQQRQLGYESYEVAMYHMTRCKGSRASDGPVGYALRLIGCILFATHVSTHAYVLLYAYGALNDYLGKPAPSYAMATEGYAQLHDIATFYRSLFGIDPETLETRETLQSDAESQRTAMLKFSLEMRRLIWNWSSMNVAPPIIVHENVP